MLNNEQQKFEFSKTDTNTIDIVAFENKYTSVASAIIEISAVLALQQNSPFRNGEAIEHLIAFAIKNKKKVRVGMTTIEQVNNPDLHQDNRSMIAIGG